MLTSFVLGNMYRIGKLIAIANMSLLASIAFAEETKNCDYFLSNPNLKISSFSQAIFHPTKILKRELNRRSLKNALLHIKTKTWQPYQVFRSYVQSKDENAAKELDGILFYFILKK